jgi:hypothetical protein
MGNNPTDAFSRLLILLLPFLCIIKAYGMGSLVLRELSLSGFGS